MSTILIVDDDVLTLKLVALNVQKLGHKAVTHNSWTDVTESLFRTEIDLALIDIQMPGLDGDRLVEIVRKTRRGRNLALCLMSNLPEETIEQRATKVGADHWVQKPVTVEKLTQILNAIAEFDPQRAR